MKKILYLIGVFTLLRIFGTLLVKLLSSNRKGNAKFIYGEERECNVDGTFLYTGIIKYRILEKKFTDLGTFLLCKDCGMFNESYIYLLNKEETLAKPLIFSEPKDRLDYVRNNFTQS